MRSGQSPRVTPDAEDRVSTYLNPVFAKSFADPFILKFRNEYFAYSTGFADDGKVFGVVRSNDLVSWSEIGGAMEPLENSPPYYWAPEVTYDNGKFYLYYSVGNETFMELRVAVSDDPSGGFVDSGRRLTKEDFAIDAHVFIDDDGTRWLFYATDFLDYSHIGTGTVVDRMIDWFTLEGKPRPVTRAKFDWQVYDPHRKEKGGVRWHTVEGPAVMKRKGIYYEMFSGGNWQNTTYGVSFAVSDSITADDEWLQFSDGENVLPILRTVPDVAVGPGHNCIVRGPNNRDLYCVYHRWTENGRVMSIDRMDFAGKRIFVIGATSTPQPIPFQPSIKSADEVLQRLTTTSSWETIAGGELRTASEPGDLVLDRLPESYLCELTFRCTDLSAEDGTIAIKFPANGTELDILFHPSTNTVRLLVPDDAPGLPAINKLHADFDWSAEHTLRIESDHRRVHLRIDNAAFCMKTFLSETPRALIISPSKTPLAITSFALTEGFEELFTSEEPLESNGWTISGPGEYHIRSGEVSIRTDGEFILGKGSLLSYFEFAANFRTLDERDVEGSYGLLLTSDDHVFHFSIDRQEKQLKLTDQLPIDLPAGLTLGQFHQLRVIKLEGRALCYFDDVAVGAFPIFEGEMAAAIMCERTNLAVEMIRHTAI